ncbi:MAG: formate/nitrite transporter family protein [Peptococcaceae bacterium]|nr:formate/nitrite transporter family protein [Peptococcaceae bacterium]
MSDQKLTVDILTPDAVTEKAESTGVKKAKYPLRTTVMLGILAGVFIALAGEFYTMVVFEAQTGYSIARLLGGLAFSLGLILVVITGAELFTGNTLLVIAYMTKKITLKDLLRNWLLVYTGNFIGSIAVVLLVYYSHQWVLKEYSFAVQAVQIGIGKVSNDFFTAMVRGVLANTLVVLAVWMSYSGRTLTDKLLAVIFPISAFVASGFEHSIANMYFIPMALMLKGNEAVQQALLAAAPHADISLLTVQTFITRNLIPVTIGNIIGGAVFVGLAYWFVYLYKRA